MMSWQAWSPPEGWPIGAPSVRWQRQVLEAGHEASLWLFNLDADEADTPALTGCLNEDERARAQRFRQPMHGGRHRVARAMLRHLLGHLSQRPAAALTWLTGPHGKPALSNAGSSAGGMSSLHFNLSHSGHWALLATSATLELGVDIEEDASRERLPEMAHRILSVEERPHQATSASDLAAIATFERRENELHLLRAWTRKEACLKALGTGLHREMDTLTLEATHARTANAHLATHGPLPTLGWADLPLPGDCPAWAACAWLVPAGMTGAKSGG